MIIIRRVIDCILILLVLGTLLIVANNITNGSITGYNILGTFMVSPGGCKTAEECHAYCDKNLKECNKFCRENPEFCGTMKKKEYNPQNKKFEPPDVIIDYIRTVNLNQGAFTEEDIENAKDLGANAITYWPRTIIQNDEPSLVLSDDIKTINAAYRNGLQVELRSSYGGEKINNYNHFRDKTLEYAREWGEFAEENKLYGIIPFGEIDNTLIENCDKITSFAKEMLAETRKYYSGKIGIGIAAPWRDCGFNFKGYDYLTVSAYPQASIGIDKWLNPKPNSKLTIDNNNLALVIKWARDVADRSNIKIVRIGETAIINPEDRKRDDYNAFAVGSKKEEAEYFKELFNQVADDVDGVSVFYNSQFDYMSVKGDPAEEVVREFFYSKGGDKSSISTNNMQKSEDNTPDFLLKAQCSQRLWPPSCDTITDSAEKKLCSECKEFVEKETQNTPTTNPIKTSVNNEKKDSLFSRMTRLFKNLFRKE